jgi:hypothetical protein
MKKWIAIAALGVVLVWAALATLHRPGASSGGAAASATESTSETKASPPAASSTHGPFPHAVRDAAKREELRIRLLAAAAENEARAKEERERAAAAPPSRGQRATNDVEEFGRFVAQAIREDFVPMARECARDLARRKPGSHGSATVAFELLGDTKIGGVVNEAEVLKEGSTLRDPDFETCVRESMYGVYFDPPPAGGRATLRFPVTLFEDGGIDEKVEDFHPRDRRNERPQ